MKRFGMAFVALLLSFGIQGDVQAETPAEQALIKSQVKIDQNLGATLPLELSFVDETGRAVVLGDYFQGKPVLITPVYYKCPMLCTLTLTDLVNALKVVPLVLGKDFEIVTFSINPNETPDLAAKKKESYLQVYHQKGSESGWHFLTGKPEEITALTQALGFRYTYDKASGEYAHASSIIVASPKGIITHYFTGIGIEPKNIRLALVDASQGKVGNLIDLILLMCYHYDPSTGRYGLAITTAIRIAGVLTVLVIAIAIVSMLKAEKRRSRS